MDEKSWELFNIFSLLRKLEGLNKQRVESFGLNNLESIILFHIDKLDMPTQKDLVKKLKMPKQTVNSIIMNLKENNLINLVPSTDDKRVKTLKLTDMGALKVKNITDALSLSDQKIYNQLGKDKIKTIEEDLNLIISVLEDNMKKEVK